jgi:hypothetical protein
MFFLDGIVVGLGSNKEDYILRPPPAFLRCIANWLGGVFLVWRIRLNLDHRWRMFFLDGIVVGLGSNKEDYILRPPPAFLRCVANWLAAFFLFGGFV